MLPSPRRRVRYPIAVLDDVERELIVKALEAALWNRGHAAQLLGISKETLRYRMEKYRLQPHARTSAT